MYCSKCGQPVAEGAAFCGACGQPTAATGIAPPPPQAYAPPVPYAPALPSPYAGFWLRFVALLIDSFILTIPFGIIFGFLIVAMGLSGALHGFQPGESPDALFAILGTGFIFMIVVVAIGGSWLYYALTESSSWQGTLGKKALGLYVTDLAGHRVSFARATGRFFGKIVSGHLTLYIGYMMAGFTQKKQALHDMMAGCLVLRKL